MKKIFLFLLFATVATILLSCGEAAPVKEIEDAKTAIERAKSVEAPVYAREEYREAENNFNTATDLLSKKKSKEAKEKAIVSKEKADLSYNLAITNRAVSIYTECSNLFVEIDDYYGNKVEPEKYGECQTEFNNMGADLEAGKVDVVYENGKTLKPKLEEFLGKLKDLYGDIATYISKVEDKLSELKENEKAMASASDILDQADGKLAESKEDLENGEYESAREKAKEAEELCNKIEGMITSEIQPEKVEKKVEEKATEEEVKKDLEKNKDDALKAIKKAKEKQEKLKLRKKILYYKPKYNNFAITEFKTFSLADEVSLDAEKTNEENVSTADVSEEAVASTEETLSSKEAGETEDMTLTEDENLTDEQSVSVGYTSAEDEEVTDESTSTEEEVAGESEVSSEDKEAGVKETEAVGETETALQDEIRVKDEDITEEMVNKYISIAQELYDKGEYTKSLIYANEAIRMADILLEKDYSKYYRVRKGDCLWNIAKFFYKNPVLWPVIYKANKNKIKHPDLIYPKQVFEIPPKPKDINIRKLYKEINYKPLFR
ncbi:MAG: LysM peptidoglycan-binding domain-containing protein [Brevinematia bacterium]